MSALREDEFESFIKKRSGTMKGILIHGADEGAVSSLAQQALRAVVGAGDPSFATVRLSAPSLKDNPSLLDDEFRSISLLGERRVILVDGVDDSHLKFVTSLLGFGHVGNFVILLAEALGKSSKLRSAIEDSDRFAALAIYDEDASVLAARIRKQLANDNLVWEGDAEELFFSTVGYDRTTAVQEAGKLSLFCLGLGKVTCSDVEASCGGTAAYGTDELIDAVLSGDLEDVDRSLSGLDAELGGSKVVLSMMLLHLSKLQGLRGDMDRGLSADVVVRSAKPMIFFKRRSAFVSQLRKFDLDNLIAMQQTVSAAMFQARKFGDLFEAITSRTLLSMARLARNARS